MTTYRNLLLIFLLSIILLSCGTNTSLEPNYKPTFEDLFFGTDSTFEVMTWNLKEFPLNGNKTIDYVVQIVKNLDIDVIAFQEIDNRSSFNNLINALDDWDGYRANSAAYNVNLAFLYKKETVEINEKYEIYPDESRPFPRAPLLIELTWNTIPIKIINNHFKSGGNGLIEIDEWDEERRRYDASILLEDYINENLANDNVIVVGDLNDSLIDSDGKNVFLNFIEDTDNYLFADMAIAEGNHSNWSWKGWSSYPSHLDHILITNELFDEFNISPSEVQTIKIDELMNGGSSTYLYNISDHRPVALRLKF